MESPCLKIRILYNLSNETMIGPLNEGAIYDWYGQWNVLFCNGNSKLLVRNKNLLDLRERV